MISLWYFIPIIAIGFLSGYLIAIWVLKNSNDVSYAIGIKKGHDDMQERIANVIKRFSGSKIHGTCESCDKVGQVCMSAGPLLCRYCDEENKNNSCIDA